MGCLLLLQTIDLYIRTNSASGAAKNEILCKDAANRKCWKTLIQDIYLAVSSATVSEVLTMHKSFHLRRAALGDD